MANGKRKPTSDYWTRKTFKPFDWRKDPAIWEAFEGIPEAVDLAAELAKKNLAKPEPAAKKPKDQPEYLQARQAAKYTSGKMD